MLKKEFVARKAARGDGLTTAAASSAGATHPKQGFLADSDKKLASNNEDTGDIVQVVPPARKRSRRFVESHSSARVTPVYQDAEEGNDDAEDEAQVQAGVDAQISAEMEAWIKAKAEVAAINS